MKSWEKLKKQWVKRHGHTSYSQSGEDMIVQSIFLQRGIERPSYLDLGANHPFQINNTASFYLKGSSGINVEPAITEFRLFEKWRPRDVNLNMGVSDVEGHLHYFETENSRLNTFDEKEAKRYETEEGIAILNQKEVQVKTVRQILDEHWNGKFPDFLTIDIEGTELSIMKSIDFDQTSPMVICAETLSFSATGNEQKNDELIQYICDQGFKVYADTYINTIFVRSHSL